MSCFSVVTTNTKVKATLAEMKMALEAMKHTVMSATDLTITLSNGTRLFRIDDQASWNVTGVLDQKQFAREIARAKIVLEAKRLGYSINRDEIQGVNMVVRVGMR